MLKMYFALTDTLQVWIPKVIFSTFVTLSSSKLRTAWTLSRHLIASFNKYFIINRSSTASS